MSNLITKCNNQVSSKVISKKGKTSLIKINQIKVLNKNFVFCVNKRVAMEQILSMRNADDVLLQKIKDGSNNAFNILFQKYWEKAYSEAYKRLKNQDDAKDIVQEIFTKLWLNRQTQNIENFSAYLHVAIRNNVIKLLSKKKPVHPFFDIIENIPEKNSGPDANMLWNEFLQSYESLLEKMPPKRQEIFRLRYHENQTTSDISLQFGITRKTVQNQLGKAIQSLKVALHIISLTGMILIMITTFKDSTFLTNLYHETIFFCFVSSNA